MGYKVSRRKPARKPRNQFEERHLWMLSLLRDYVGKHGWDDVTHKLVVSPGANLGTWIQHRRAAYRKGKLADWLIEELESIPGWEWDPIRARHQKHLDAVFDFLEEHTLEELTSDTVFQGLRIGQWIAERRTAHSKGKTTWVTDELEAIPGWSWAPREDLFEERLHQADAYLSALSATELIALGRWIRRRRKQYRDGELSHAEIRECEAVPGWTWTRSDET